jgi:hypothetical protein
MPLTQDEACKLTADRMERLQAEAGEGAHLQLMKRSEPRTPSLLITGKKVEDVDAAYSAAAKLLHKEPGLVLTLHPADLAALRRGAADIEKRSGCRLVVHAGKSKAVDTDVGPRICEVELLGEQAAQARAVQLIIELCPPAAELNGSLAQRGGELKLFSPLLRGINIELYEGGAVARRRPGCCKGRSSAADCVVAGAGPVGKFSVGRFWCFAVRARDRTLGRDFRGGTRVGIVAVPPSPPVPDSLLAQPGYSWVLGRGVARGPDMETQAMPQADFDSLAEGDAIGLLVTSGAIKGQKGAGRIKIYMKPKDSEDWVCRLEWNAGVTQPDGEFFAVLELGGQISEVVMLLPDMGSGQAYGSPEASGPHISSGQPLYLGPPETAKPSGQDPVPPCAPKPPESGFTGKPRPGRTLDRPSGSGGSS